MAIHVDMIDMIYSASICARNKAGSKKERSKEFLFVGRETHIDTHATNITWYAGTYIYEYDKAR
jgi:hypothetical protein